MKCLVIGGTGYIGARVTADLLGMGHAVTVFHRGTRSVPPAAAEIIGARRVMTPFQPIFRRLHPDVVVDMILSSSGQARELMTTVRGFAGRVVAVSSMDVYRACGILHGTEPGPLEPVPLTEESPLRTRTAYGEESLASLRGVFPWLDQAYDKVGVESEVLGDKETPAVVVRLPMVYGPGDPLHRLHPYLKRMEDGRPAILFDSQAAAWRGSRGYVDDVARAIALAATGTAAPGRIYNVAEPEACSEAEWVRRVARTARWTGEILALPAGAAPAHLRLPFNMNQHWVASSELIRRELSYREHVAADDAMARTVDWEREHSPVTFNPAAFDYAAEDAAIAAAVAAGNAVRVA